MNTALLEKPSPAPKSESVDSSQTPGPRKLQRPSWPQRLRDRISLFLSTRILEPFVMRRQIEKFYLILGGHIYFQTLSAAVQLDLFSLLRKQPRLTCAEIARALNIEEKPARILLLGCTSLGLLIRRHDVYRNTRLADKLLTKESPQNILSVIQWQHHVNYRAMFHFHDAIQANRNVGLEVFEGNESTLYERLVHHPDLERVFQDAMEDISIQANDTLAKFVDFTDVRHIVDVGGGNGTNLMKLASRYAELRGTVFDSPSVCAVAEENISQAGFSHRIGTNPGDCFADAFPAGADCFLFSHFCTIWSEEQNRRLLAKAFQALPANGKVVIFNMMQSDSRGGPLSAALGSPYFLTIATGEGMLYTWTEYETWMKEAGFTTTRRQLLPRDHGAIIGVKR